MAYARELRHDLLQLRERVARLRHQSSTLIETSQRLVRQARQVTDARHVPPQGAKAAEQGDK